MSSLKFLTFVLFPFLLLIFSTFPTSALKIQLEKNVFNENENITLTVLTTRDTVVQLISEKVVSEIKISSSSTVEFPPQPPGTYTVYATDGFSDAVKEIKVIEALSIETPHHVYLGEKFSIHFKGSGNSEFAVVSDSGEKIIAREINLNEIRSVKISLNKTGTYRLILSGDTGKAEERVEVTEPFLEAKYQNGLLKIQSGKNRTIMILFITESGKELEKITSNGSIALPMKGYRAIVADAMGREVGTPGEFERIYTELPHVVVEKKGGLPELAALSISTFIVALVLSAMVFILRGGR